MHIPDGYPSPLTCAVANPFWVTAARGPSGDDLPGLPRQCTGTTQLRFAALDGASAIGVLAFSVLVLLGIAELADRAPFQLSGTAWPVSPPATARH